MAKEKILKPIETFLEEQGVKASLKAFLSDLYLPQQSVMTRDDIDNLLDEGLEEFAKLVGLTTPPANREFYLTRLEAMFGFGREQAVYFFDTYQEALGKSYRLKISRFFNELVLVSLALIVPTLVQLYAIDEFSILSAVWLTIPITGFSLLRESNIMEFISVHNRYKPMIVKDYFRNLFKGNNRNKHFNVLAFPYYLVKWVLTFLHSFLFQYKFQVLFYIGLATLVLVGYQNTKDIIADMTGQTSQSQVAKTKKTSASQGEEKKKEDKKVLTIPVLVKGDTLTLEEEEPQEFTGSLTEAAAEQRFTYTAPHDGVFGLAFVDLKADISLDLTVKDEAGKVLDNFYQDGGTLSLSAGKTYEVLVGRRGKDTDFKLLVFAPKALTDISSASVVEDQLAFKGQVNTYQFLAPRDGVYSFALLDANEQTGLDMAIFNALDERLERSTERRLIVKLEAGETYRLVVAHDKNRDLGTYRLALGLPKETSEVTGYDLVKDELEYAGQQNVYHFSPEISGRYGFWLTEKLADAAVNILVYDQYGELVAGDTYRTEASVLATLEEAKDYYITVVQSEGLTSYSLNLGYARPVTALPKSGLVDDELTFGGEVVRYSFKPKTAGTYQFTTTDNVTVAVFNKYKEELTGYSGEVVLEANQTYTLVVTSRQGDIGAYKLEVTGK